MKFQCSFAAVLLLLISTATSAETQQQQKRDRRLIRLRGIGDDAAAEQQQAGIAAVAAATTGQRNNASVEANKMRLLLANEEEQKVEDKEDWMFWARELAGSASVRRQLEAVDNANRELQQLKRSGSGGRQKLIDAAAAADVDTKEEDFAFWTRELEGGSMS